jgi:hypothetical protein
MNVKKDVTYINKDFSQFRKNLIDFTKQYFPNTYTDFSDSSPGTLFIELAAYVGDVLSYYTDTNLKESLLEQATERTNIYDIARSLGYSARNAVPAYVTMDIFQLVPSIGTGTSNRPDYTYALSIKSGMQIKQNNGAAIFRTLESVDFIKPGYRRCVCGVDSIFYKINGDEVEIMAIFGRQDLNQLL